MYIIAGLLIAYAVFLYTIDSREYEIDSEGIVLRYAKLYRKRYAWNEITEISICDIHHAPKNRDSFDIAIRILVGTEDKSRESLASILSGIDNWRSYEYEVKNFQKIIILDYSRSRVEKIREASRKEVKDYLTAQAKLRLESEGDDFTI